MSDIIKNNSQTIERNIRYDILKGGNYIVNNLFYFRV